jgi:hypothetical protein
MRLRSGGDSFDRIFMAMAQRRLGHKEEARQWYERAVEKIRLGWVTTRDFTVLDLERFLEEAQQLIQIEPTSWRSL